MLFRSDKMYNECSYKVGVLNKVASDCMEIHIRALKEVSCRFKTLSRICTKTYTKTHRRVATGVQQEIGGMGSDAWLSGNWPMAQSHSNDGSHVGLSAKDMDGDACGFA